MSQYDRWQVVIFGGIYLLAIIFSQYKIAAMAGFVSISLLLMGIESQL